MDGLLGRRPPRLPEPVVDVLAPDLAIETVQLVVMGRDVRGGRLDGGDDHPVGSSPLRDLPARPGGTSPRPGRPRVARPGRLRNGPPGGPRRPALKTSNRARRTGCAATPGSPCGATAPTGPGSPGGPGPCRRIAAGG